jgi:GT2 family glycosyltransferase
MATMSTDIIIVNFYSSNDVEQCLDRLGVWTDGVVWVVDNSDDASEARKLQAICLGRTGVRVDTAHSNLGFGRGCNLAFAQSKADLVLLLNPDARISPDNIDLLVNAIQSQPHSAAVSPRMYWNEARSFMLPPASSQTPVACIKSALASYSRRGARSLAERELQRLQEQLQPTTPPFEVPMLAGAVLLLRRQAVLNAGGLFDSDYFMFFEDADLSLRLRRAGYALFVVPAASAEHEYRHKPFKAAMMDKSQHQYFSKQYPAFYRWSDKLSLIAALARPITTEKWFKVITKPVTSAQEFAANTDNGRVLAFSPSVLMTPALFRPSFMQAQCFSEPEWALLEPAYYSVLVQSTEQDRKPDWFYFERAKA